VKYSEQLDELMLNIAEIGESSPHIKELTTGMICLAKYSADDGWYRGRILEGNTVEFVDYGNTEEVDGDNIRELPVEFSKLPQTCIKVALHDVHADDVDLKAAKTWVESSIVEAEVKLEVISVNSPSSIEAYVYVGASDIHINDQLYSYFAKCTESAEGETETIECEDTDTVENEDITVTPAIEINKEHELAPSLCEDEPKTEVKETREEPIVHEICVENPDTKAIQIPSPELDASDVGVDTICFVVESAVSLKCQLMKYSEQLDVLMSSIAEIGESSPHIKELTPGMICLAKYSVDDGWYRGRILEGNTVEFVDYGNTEDVDGDNIRELPVKFTNLPQTCITVILHDVHTCDVDVEAAKAWLEENVLEREVRLEVAATVDPLVVEAYVENNGSHVNDEIYEQFESFHDARAASSATSVCSTITNCSSSSDGIILSDLSRVD